MKIGYVDIHKVKFLIDDSEDNIEYAIEMIEIEIKTEEYMISGGNHLSYDDSDF